MAALADEVAASLAQTLADTFALYVKLDPSGRELNDAERDEVWQRLEVGALCLREADAHRDIVEFMANSVSKPGKDRDFRPMISVLRSMQRSLVLALAEDPERRAHALSADQLRARVLPIYRFWQEW